MCALLGPGGETDRKPVAIRLQKPCTLLGQTAAGSRVTACCNSLSCCFLSKTTNTKIRTTTTSPVALSGRETWSVTLREEQAEDVIENGTGE